MPFTLEKRPKASIYERTLSRRRGLKIIGGFVVGVTGLAYPIALWGERAESQLSQPIRDICVENRERSYSEIHYDH